MHKAVTFLFLIFLLSIPAFAKTSIPAFEKARQIKLLESTREDARRIFADLKTANDRKKYKDDENVEFIYTKDVRIEISYTSGECADEAEDTDEWKIGEGKAKYIEIFPQNSISTYEWDFDTSDFLQDRRFYDDFDNLTHYDKNAGISFETEYGEIKVIRFFPSDIYRNELCQNEKAAEMKDFYERKVFYEDSVSNTENTENLIDDRISNVTNLTLSAKNLFIRCSNSDEKKDCNNDLKINVQTTAIDTDSDRETYKYIVSAGKIIGEGAEVVWDLTDVKEGNYIITAGIEIDGKILGQTKTETVIIKEGSDCLPK